MSKRYKLIVFDLFGTLLPTVSPGVEMYQGMSKLLRDIHHAGISLGLATNAPSMTIMRFQNLYEEASLFQHIESAPPCDLKPSCDMLEKIRDIEEIYREEKIELSEMVMIGDSLSDVYAAKSLGCDVIYIQHQGVMNGMVADQEPTHFIAGNHIAEKLAKILL